LKRHFLVDTLEFLLHAVVHPADIQDRDGGVLVVSHPVRDASLLEKALRVFQMALAKALPCLEIEIV
jgi:putative transposase